MRFKKLKDNYYLALKAKDDEVLSNHGGNRPYVILANLIYKGKKQTFAIPCRSNINSHVPEHTRFVLPRRHTTRDGNLHGLHYIKLVPANKKLLENVQTNNNTQLYLDIIEEHISEIENDLQKIINNYEIGIKEEFCTDLEVLFEVYETELSKAKAFDKLKISIKKNILDHEFLYIDDLDNISPQEYVNIKNGIFGSYIIQDGIDDSHKKMIIFAKNSYGQKKSVTINIIIAP